MRVKRSEVLTALEGRLMAMDAQIKDGMTYSEKADALLTFLERCGMLPPLIKTETTDIYNQPFCIFKNEWENESEKK